MSGCKTVRPETGVATARVDTLWYATSRLRQQDRLGSRLSDSLEYGFYLVASRTNVDVMRANLHLRILDSAIVTGAAFRNAMASPSRDTGGVVVLSVHGYSTDQEKAVRDAAEAYVRSGTRARWVAFSWPSSGRGLNLLRPGRFFITSTYRADSLAASRSQPAFARLLLSLHETVGGERLVLVTHSLGAQLATETLASDSMVRAPIGVRPLRAVGLFEPDLAARRFGEYSVPLLRRMTQRLAVYASRNDGVLRFSRLLNGSDRAGLFGDTYQHLGGLETIDVTDGLTSEDWFRRRFGTHHTMKKESSALRDFFNIVVAGAPPHCRITRGTATQSVDSVWRLLPVRAINQDC